MRLPAGLASSALAFAGLAFAAATSLAGCMLVTSGGSVGSTSCADIAGGACQEQADRVAARHPGATSVELTCTVPVCDRKGGAGTAVVTMPNGAKVNDTFAYTGDPGPAPVPACVGLGLDVCRSIAAAQADNVAPSKRIVAMKVACTAAMCTAAKGEATVTITLGDGTTQQGSVGWEGGMP